MALHELVPRDPRKNRAFRLKQREKCIDPSYRADFTEMCRHDLLFWSLACGMVHEPRAPAHLPFIPYKYEEDLILDLHNSVVWREMGVMESKDLTAVKSRGTGFTWCCCYLIAHRFLFQDGFTAGVVSASAEKVDNSDDPNTIFFKLEYILNWLPKWMQPPGWPRENSRRLCRSEMKLKHYSPDGRLLASVNGFAASEDAGRGGRTTMFMFDEVAHFPPGQDFALYSSLQPITDCRIMGSTPNGSSGLFYERVHDHDAEHTLVRMPWWQHPKWGIGRYTSRKVGDQWHKTIIDKSYRFPRDYPFILDGRMRSPWYDRECRRAPSMQWMAQNYDMDFLGSGSPFFDIPTLVQLQKHPRDGGTCRDPDHRGDLICREGEPFWSENHMGRFKLWKTLVKGKVPGNDPYVVGVDIGSGGGDKTNNSAISVVNRRTGEKVAQYVDNEIDPQDLAELAVWTCEFFNHAFLIWDANGPNGVIFGKHILRRTEYRYFFRRSSSSDENSKARGRNLPGFSVQGKNKAGFYGDYAAALRTGEFINPAFDALEECKAYVYVDGMKIAHRASRAKNNPSGSGESHGDIATADALAWRAIREFPKFENLEQTTIVSLDSLPEHCYARRRRKWEQAQHDKEWW